MSAWFEDLPLDFTRDETREAERLLITGYQTQIAVIRLAQNAGLDVSSINMTFAVADIIREMLIKARSAGLLVLLLEQALCDPGQVAIRDRLQELAADRNAVTAAIQGEVAHPGGDPRRAVHFGRQAFVDRDPLRSRVDEFITPHDYSSHVLVIRGEEACGKSYSWLYLSHVARVSASAIPIRISLEELSTPHELFETIFGILGFDNRSLPLASDNPQLARVSAFVGAFLGQAVKMQGERYWLGLDEVNHPRVTPALRESAHAIAKGIEDAKPQKLWLVLLGYNDSITDGVLRFAPQDDAEFPGEQHVAEYFQLMAPGRLEAKRARQLADALFQRYSRFGQGNDDGAFG